MARTPLRVWRFVQPHFGGTGRLSQAEWFDFAPARRLTGLPAPLPDLDAVLARDSARRWQPLTNAPPNAWRFRLEGEEARLAAN